MKILCIGDVVGKPGRKAVTDLLPVLKEEFGVNLVVVNAENAAGGLGLTPRIAKDFFRMGCDVLTLGDHVWDREELKEFLFEEDRILRPANFPEETPGKGWCILEVSSGCKVGVINLLGRVFMRYNVNCPFTEGRKIIEQMKSQTKVILIDFHAEATSEKIAMGHFMDGQVSAILGSHTHVQTADEKILACGTAYLTDMGMTGPQDSVIGQNKEKIIKRFLTSMPLKFEVAAKDIVLNGVVVDIDEMTGKANSIVRIQRRLSDSDDSLKGEFNS